MSTYTIIISVCNSQNQPRQGLIVEASDRDRKYHDKLGEAITNEKGQCIIQFGEEAFKDYAEEKVDVFFRVYDGLRLLLDTEGNTYYNVQEREISVKLVVPEYDVKEEARTIYASLENLGGFSEPMQRSIANKLNALLRKRVLESLDLDASRAQQIVHSLGLDYRGHEDTAFDAYIKEMVLPAILKDEELKAAWENQEGRNSLNDRRPIREVLNLGTSMRKHPDFYAEVNQLRTQLIGEQSGMKPRQILALQKDGVNLGLSLDAQIPRLLETQLIDEDQVEPLMFYSDLSRLTGDHFNLIGSLVESHGIGQATDLAKLDKEDWQSLIEAQGNLTPEDESPEDYASNLATSVEQAMPSRFFMHRVVEREPEALPSRLKVPTRLGKQNERMFVNGKVNPKLNWEGFSDKKRKEAEAELSEVQALLNTYRHLGLEEIMNMRELTAQQKASRVKGAIQTAARFYTNNPKLDLQRAQFVGKDKVGFNWQGIPDAMQAPIEQQMMSYQRVMRISPSTAASQQLLTKGYDAANQVTKYSRARFLEHSGLELEQGKAVYQKAVDGIVRTSTALQLGKDMMWGKWFNMPWDNSIPYQAPGLGNMSQQVYGNTPQEAFESELMDIPGYADLFGPQNYCNCKHCRSVLSPAAYFVDLMRFIQTYVKYTNQGVTDLYFEAQHPNHVLLLKNRRPDLWDLPLTCENTNTLVPFLTIANEIKEAFIKKIEQVSDVYAHLSQAHCSLRQPFNRPFEESKKLLEKFGLSLYEIACATQQTGQQQSLAYLGLNETDLQAILAEKENIAKRYGDPADSSRFEVCKFLRITDLTREELTILIKLPFILATDTLTIEPDTSNPNYPIQSYEEFVEGFGNASLNLVHQFLYYHKVTGYSLPELDLVLDSLDIPSGDSIIDPVHAAKLGHFHRLQSTLKLSVEEVCALVKAIPQRSIKSRKRFNPIIEEEQIEMLPSMWERRVRFDEWEGIASGSVSFHHDTFQPTGNAPLGPDVNTPRLLAVLGLTEPALLELLQMVQDQTGSFFDGNGNANLDHGSLSMLYQHSLMAKKLDLSMREYGLLIRLRYTNVLPSQVEDWVSLEDFTARIEASPLTIDDCWFYLRRSNTPSVQHQDWQEAITGIIQRFQVETLAFGPAALTKVDLPDAIDPLIINETEILSEGEASLFIETLVDQGADIIPLGDDQYRMASSYAGSVSNSAFTQAAAAVAERRYPDTSSQEYLDTLTNLVGLKAYIENVLNELFARIVAANSQSISLFMDTLLKEGTGLKEVVWNSLTPYIDEHWVQSKSATLAVELLTYIPPESQATQGSAPELLDILHRIEEVKHVFDVLEFEADQQAWLTSLHAEGWSQATLGITDLTDISLEALLDTSLLQEYRDRDEGEMTAFVERTVAAFASQTTADTGGFSSLDSIALAGLLKVDEMLLQSCIQAAFGLSGTAITALAGLDKLLQTCQALGTNGHSLKKLDAQTYQEYKDAYQVLYHSFRAQYDTEEAFEDAWEPYLDRFNELRRDALCDYILTAIDVDPKLETESDLYAFFLLDVKTEGCARTSRVKQATLSVQAYIHRIFMNLEQAADGHKTSFSDPEEAAQLWDWMRFYRVWEANRKVFLWPGNLVEPEWRDNKSPIFKELEDELLQEKISMESAEAAYKVYLKKFGEVGSLKTAGVYFFKGENGLPPAYHVFGRTQTDPYQYFYRQYINIDATSNVWEWTAWEKVDLPISAPYVSAIIRHGRLFVFWVKVVTRKNEGFNNGSSGFLNFENTITFNYSYLAENGKWVQPQEVGLFRRYGDNQLTNQAFTFLEDTSHRTFDGSSYSNLTHTAIDKKQAFETSKSYLKCYPNYRSSDGRIILHYLQAKSKALYGNITYRGVQLDPNGSSPKYDLHAYYNSYDPSQDPAFPILGNHPVLKHIFQDKELSRGRPFYLDLFENKAIRTYGRGWDETYRSKNLELATDGSKVWLAGSRLPAITSTYDLDILLKPSNIYDSNNTRPSWGPLSPKVDVVDLPLDLDVVLHKDGGFIYSIKKEQLLLLPLLENFPFSIWGSTRLNTSIPEKLSRILIEQGVKNLLSLDSQMIGENPLDQYFLSQVNGYSYGGITLWLPPIVKPLEPANSLPFQGSHGLYFRELFFHIPYLIADHLNANQKFKEADWWYRKIFDPTAQDDSVVPATDRGWQYLEFRGLGFPNLEAILSDSAAIRVYETDPFNPHAIARLRLSAYQKGIVMKYVDNLLDWGDQKFSQFTFESMNEALMLYMLAKDILGERPCELGDCETTDEATLTWKKIEENEDANSKAPFLLTLENWVPVPLPFANTVYNVNATELAGQPKAATGITYQSNFQTYSPAMRLGTSQVSELQAYGNITWANRPELAFCIPPNEKLFDYYDRVDDRLFKLRNCMNIDGVKGQPALFQPAIDPALLVAAKAAGLSIDDVMTGLLGPAPIYRFNILLEKAKGFAGTVQSFGGALLSALEKQDAEELTLLRSVHERNILKLSKELKKKAIEESQANLQNFLETKKNVQNRVDYYAELIDKGLIAWERLQQVATHSSSLLYGVEGVFNTAASLAALIPNGGAPTAMTYGGREISGNAAYVANLTNSAAKVFNLLATSAGHEAGNQRREEGWKHQLDLAEQELVAMEQQIIASQIRLAVAEKDLEIHDKQTEQVDELYDFYKNKFSNKGLYKYLSSNLARLYRQAYSLAHDLAKQAEAAYHFETDDDTSFFIEADNWDVGQAGLLSGEKLSIQLQQMEKAYLEKNERKLEITQSFSVRMIDPVALQELRKEGECTFTIPEALFDLYYPGHYKRLIKSVRLTIPCLTGPYTNVAANLSLISSSLRTDTSSTTTSAPGHVFKGMNLVASSNANNDGGQFELNFQDAKFLPFEGSGAVNSKFNITLPKTLRPFDYDSISDVILTISYTSKFDGAYKDTVEGELLDAINDIAETNGLSRLVSMKEEFPDVLYQLQQTGASPKAIELTKAHFPFFVQAKKLSIEDVSYWGSTSNAFVSLGLASGDIDDSNPSYSISIQPSIEEDVILKIDYELKD